MTSMTPPRWAEAVLRIVLPRRDRETVSGDLLEEYREHVAPTRGVPAADRWYVRQVAGFVWRSQWGWAVALSVVFVGRVSWDWLIPTTDFHVRAEIATYASASVLLLAGAVAGWRSQSIAAGAIAGAAVAIIAAAFDLAASSLLLATLPHQATFAAAEQSGGISEVFTLPFILIVRATVLGLLGGLPAAVSQRLRR